jgi:hypothetical protein
VVLLIYVYWQLKHLAKIIFDPHLHQQIVTFSYALLDSDEFYLDDE